MTKADGSKFGKTESGTIWLDAKRTSPYAFYQFWLNTVDADVYKFLRYFTFLGVNEIDAIEGADRQRDGRPEAQGILAREVTRLVHGEEGLAAAERISHALFSGDITDLSAADLEQLRLDGLPSSTLPKDFSGQSLISLLVDAGMAPSGKPVKDALGRSAVLINGEAKGMGSNAAPAAVFSADKALSDSYFIVRLGKKKYHLFTLAD